jgi:ribonucleoside-diphosphate reductase alpha chain
MTDVSSTTYQDLNANLNLLDNDGKIQFDKDKEAVKAYFIENINLNTVFFHSLEEKLDYLFKEGFYKKDIFDQYSFKFVKALYKKAYMKKFRFKTYMGAFKFYTQYAMKTLDGERYLERYEDRIVAVALTLAKGDESLASNLVEEIITGRYQPATPTFLNAARVRGGEQVSCFLMRVEDNMESISRSINGALQLSKRGGGVSILLSNLRESGAPIKGMKNQSTGVVPVMKILEDSFTYANQLGARQGAGVVYLNAHHPDILRFLDTKRENADEKIRIKTLSLGVVIPDITFELARKNEPMYLFSPYDVERVYGKPFSDISISEKYYEMVDDQRITKKKISPREFFKTIAEIQMESGYPYILFEDTATRADTGNGKINMSNLCVDGLSEITISSDINGSNIASISILELKELIKNELDHNLYVKTYKDDNVIYRKMTGFHGKGFVSELIEIEYDNKILRVTPDHEIYTKNRGWVKAQDLLEHDILVID